MTLDFNTSYFTDGSGGGGSGAVIDDTTVSTQTAYSSSKCVNTFVSSTNIRNMISLTQAQYDALATKDANTCYVITDAS